MKKKIKRKEKKRKFGHLDALDDPSADGGCVRQLVEQRPVHRRIVHRAHPTVALRVPLRLVRVVRVSVCVDDRA
eukprot:590743-Prorocentrum_minimum.AAC.1